MLERLLLPLLNRMLAEQPGERNALRPHAGKAFGVNVGGLSLRLAIDAGGQLQASAAGQAVDVQIDIPAAALPHLFEGAPAVQAQARVNGDAGLADVLSRLAGALRPELGAWLSPLVGDVLANRIERGVAALAAAGRRSAAGLSANLGEYLKEESGLAVSTAELQQHRMAVERLHADLMAMERSVARWA